MQFLENNNNAIKTIDIAKMWADYNKKTNNIDTKPTRKSVNPTLYQMQKLELIEKICNEDLTSPKWRKRN